MFKGLLKFFIFIIIILFISNINANNIYLDVASKKYTINNGLISNTVNSIIQDEEGYIWLCTDKGLCRFDGVNFEFIDLKKYGIDESEFIYCFKQSSTKKIYFLSSNFNYISLLNKTFKLEFINDSIEQKYNNNNIIKDNYGHFWIIEKNKLRDVNSNKFFYFNKLPFYKDYLIFNNDYLYISNFVYQINKDSLTLIDTLPPVFIGMKYFHYNNCTYFQPKQKQLGIYKNKQLNYIELKI